MNKEKYFELLNEDQALIDEVYEKYSKQLKKVKKHIIEEDKNRFPDADEEDGVVDISCLDTWIFAAMIQAHWDGMLKEHQREI